MDSINSFIHLLDKIETQDRRLGMTIKNLRCLTGGEKHGAGICHGAEAG